MKQLWLFISGLEKVCRVFKNNYIRVQELFPLYKILNINFHIPSIFPTVENPVDVHGIIKTVDIVMHDIYPGWHQYPRALDHIVAFETKFLRCLTDKPLWTILQGHKIMLGFTPTLEQIEQWALDATECGSDFIGWYACEHDFMIGIWVKLKTEYTRYDCPERWKKMLEVSKKITKKKMCNADVAIFTSYNSLLPYGYLPLMYAYITLRKDANIEVDFITEKLIEKNPSTLEKYYCILSGHTPILRKSMLPIFEEYVKNGGLFIVCCNDIQFDEKLRKISEWRKKLFGIVQEKIFWEEKTITVTSKIPELRGVKLKGFWERRAISKIEDSVDILAVWSSGEPAIISKKVGNGRTIYIGTRPYLANCMRNERKWAKLIAKLVSIIK